MPPPKAGERPGRRAWVVAGWAGSFGKHGNPRWRCSGSSNHPRVNDDWNPAYVRGLEASGEVPRLGAFTCPRFDLLVRDLEGGDDVTFDLVRSVLSSREGEGRRISDDTTFGCTIMVLGAEPELHIAPGRPDRNAFQVVRFD
jgi:hypothetical protein